MSQTAAKNAAAQDPAAGPAQPAAPLSPALLEQFQIFTQLYAGTQSLVYKGVRRSDQLPVILKMTLAEFPTAATIARFRLEFDLLRQLNDRFVIACHQFIRVGTRAALVLEDRAAVGLPELLAQRRELSLSNRLTIALQLALGLKAVHAAGMIHCDLKPANVIVDPLSLSPTLIDFGSAVKTSSRILTPWGMVTEATLSYMAPEQSGRHSRSIDQRSDLYSFGVVLFELVTGQLPFVAKDAVELMHLHSAKAAPSARATNPEVPPLLDRLIAKLLAKEPDARYQHATSLCEDLAQCVRLLAAPDPALDDPYELAANDFSSRMDGLQRLYGRDEVLRKLRHWVDQAGQAAGCVLCLSGEPGIGKSAVMQELRGLLPGCHYGFGKYDQLTRHVPYKGLIDALKDALRPVLALPPDELQAWRQRLLGEVAGNAGVLTSIIPELAQILGEQPEAEKLSEGQNRNRFALVMRKLISCIQPPAATLVLFLDDVQWCDSASFELLRALVQDSQDKGLVLVLAYRSGEVQPTHPLMDFLAGLKGSGLAVEHLELGGLSLTDAETLLGDMLKKPPDDCRDLARVIHTRTQGNPLFVSELMQKLVSAELVVFDADSRSWTWDLAAIIQLRLSDDVVELIGERLRRVSSGCQSLLQMASCFGASFTLRDLCILAGEEVRLVGVRLWEAVEAHLLCPVAGDYRVLAAIDLAAARNDPALKDWTLRFAHDRVLQAAREGLSAETAAAYHLAIGQGMAPQISATSAVAFLFATVGHLNAAKHLLASSGERQELARLNRRAAAEALAAVAYQAAHGYFTSGLELLGPDPWTSDFALAWELSLGLLEASNLQREPDEATFQALATDLEQRAPSDDHRVRVLIVRMHSYVSARDFSAALAVGAEALKLLGVTLPTQPGLGWILFELLRTKHQLGPRTIEDLRDLPLMQDEKHLQVLRLLMTMTAPVYFIRPKLFPIIVFKMIQLSLRHGHSPVSAYAFNVYGVLLCAAFGNIEAGYAFGRFGLELLDGMDNSRQLRGKALMVFHASVHHWKQPIRQALPEFVKAYQAAREAGDFEYAALSSLGFCAYSYLAGVELASLEARFVKYLGAVTLMRELSHLPPLKIFAQATVNLRSLTEHPYLLEGEHWASSRDDERLASEQDKTTYCIKNIVEMQLAYLFGDIERAAACGARAGRDKASIVGTAYLPVYVFYYGLTILKAAQSLAPARRLAAIAKARRLARQLRHWASHCPDNYQHKLHLLQAEIQRLRGRYRQAAQLYGQAASEASLREYVQDEALAHELAGYFFLEMANRKTAGFYLKEAAQLYEMWGALGKAHSLRSRFQALVAGAPDGRPALDDQVYPQAPAHTVHHMKDHAFDLTTLMKVSRAIFSELAPAKLYRNLMDIMIENAGCERGLIVLEDEAEWFVEASSDVDSSVQTAAQHTPLSADVMPMSIFNYVKNSRQSLIVHDASADDLFSQDAWVRAKKVRSVLCVPLMRQDSVCGVLYLENNAMSGSFTTSHIDLLNVLASQIAVSIDHARIYASLEQRVKDRTRELSESLLQLGNAQAELVQAEKMVALGAMVAGVAHEINTPLGIGITIASTIRHDTKKIMSDLGKGLRRSQLDSFLKSLDAGAQLLEKNLALVASQVNQFKRVSVPTDDVGLQFFAPDEALQMAIHGFKLQYDCSLVAITLACPSGLTVASCPEAWTQIVYNMLKNALTHAFEPGQPGHVAVAFQPDEEGYVLSFTDNGKGIAAGPLTKIFEPFYTTARTGGNMGLGLHIVFNLVYQRLKGKISCDSQLGVGTVFKIKVSGDSVSRNAAPGGSHRA